MDFNAIATALESKAAACGLNALDYVPDDLPNTGFYVGEIDIDPNKTFGRNAPGLTRRGTDEATITCRVLVARSTDKWALRKLRKYSAGSGDEALIQAIQSDQSLNGTVHGNKVVSIRTNRLFNVGESKFYGTEVDVFVIGEAS